MTKVQEQIKKIVSEVVEICNTGNKEDAYVLSSILTALRGPDNDNKILKANTTEILRGALGINRPGVKSNPNSKLSDIDVDNIPTIEGSYHFKDHIIRAIEKIQEMNDWR